MSHPPTPDPEHDRGASAIEWALLTPILIMVMLFCIQFAMVYHAQHVALAAAQAGARAARQSPDANWQGNAETTARDAVGNFGPNLLGGPEVAVGEDGSSRWVEVSGEAVQVIPGFDFRVSKRSEGPIECFRPDEPGGGAPQECGPEGGAE